jgi:hypothetical protein
LRSCGLISSREHAILGDVSCFTGDVPSRFKCSKDTDVGPTT